MVIIKKDIDKLLYALFGDIELVYMWWRTSNKAFDGKTPDEVYQVDANGREIVYNYVLSQCI